MLLLLLLLMHSSQATTMTPPASTTSCAVFVSYALVSTKDAVLYTDPAKIGPEAAAQLAAGGVVVKPYSAVVADVRARAAAREVLAMDYSKVGVRMLAQWMCSCNKYLHQQGP